MRPRALDFGILKAVAGADSISPEPHHHRIAHTPAHHHAFYAILVVRGVEIVERGPSPPPALRPLPAAAAYASFLPALRTSRYLPSQSGSDQSNRGKAVFGFPSTRRDRYMNATSFVIPARHSHSSPLSAKQNPIGPPYLCVGRNYPRHIPRWAMTKRSPAVLLRHDATCWCLDASTSPDPP